LILIIKIEIIYALLSDSTDQIIKFVNRLEDHHSDRDSVQRISGKRKRIDSDNEDEASPQPKKSKVSKSKSAGSEKGNTKEISTTSGPTFFTTPADFRTWLEENATTTPELNVGFYKINSGLDSITWKEAVDEALCYGWIDSVGRRIDEKSFMTRFTPRRAGSVWSAVNIARVESLTQEGRMTPGGLAAFERRIEARSRIYCHEQKSEIKLDSELEEIFRRNPEAWGFFQKQPPGYRRNSIWHVHSAKRRETQERRLNKLIQASSVKERVKMF